MQPGMMGQQVQQPPGAMGPTMQPPNGVMGQQQPWMMGQPMPWMMGQSYHGQWIPPPPTAEEGTEGAPQVKPESEARAGRRAARKQVESNVNVRRLGGQKPHTLRVKAGGGIDGGCEGKNAFDEALRSLVPRILDVSILKWKMQNPTCIAKLRAAIDNEFEYLEHNLSNVGFKNAVKRQMKTERSKMKGWYMSGKKQCLVFIEPDQWARLCEYWSNPETTQKAQVMANARKRVKNLSNVGRSGKAGKEAKLVRTRLISLCEGANNLVVCNHAWNIDRFPLLWQKRKRQRSPGIKEIAEDFQESEQIGACTSVSIYS
jgi:hypothetical protein